MSQIANGDTAIIEDVQAREDKRRIPIDKVGIKDIRHPVRVKDRTGLEQHTVALFNMYVNLPHNFKGTHMSRFVEILESHERSEERRVGKESTSRGAESREKNKTTRTVKQRQRGRKCQH